MAFLFEEISVFPKQELCRKNEVDILNQLPRLRKNIILKSKSGVLYQWHTGIQFLFEKNDGVL